MALKPEQQRVHSVLMDTISLLCKNSLQYNHSLRIEGVIGITTDDSDVFLVHINETIGSSVQQPVKSEAVDETEYKMPVKKMRTASLADQSTTPGINFSCGRAVAKPFSSNSKPVPVMRGIRATKTTYGSEGSTAISSTVVTESFVMGSGNVAFDTQSDNTYAGDDLSYGHPSYEATADDTGYQMWSGDDDIQQQAYNQQMYNTPPKGPPRMRRPKQVSYTLLNVIHLQKFLLCCSF